MLHNLTNSSLSGDQVVFLATVIIITLGVVTITVTKSITGLLAKLSQMRWESGLKQQMIASGLSVDAMERILGHSISGTPGAGCPIASEVVVDRDGEWSTALVLNADDGRYLVHFVGEDMSSNEWVPENRVRFPSAAAHVSASSWASFTRQSTNGAHNKPSPLETEL
jgi:hypothetical protein